MVRAEGRGRKPQSQIPMPRFPTKLKRFPIKDPALEMITRAEWAAAPRVEQDSDIRLSLPVMHIRYTFTDTRECANPEECIPFLQEFQRDYHAKGYPDVMYNYLIGSDGMLYEGQGLDWKCTVFNDPWVNSPGESISVGYIGSFRDVLAPTPFRSTSKKLEKWLYRCCFLHEMFEITPSICWPEDFYKTPPITSKIQADLKTDLTPEKLALMTSPNLPTIDLDDEPVEEEILSDDQEDDDAGAKVEDEVEVEE